MARTPAPFRQADIKRAVAGAQAAGMTVGRVEVAPDGRIVMYAADDVIVVTEPSPDSNVNEWDTV